MVKSRIVKYIIAGSLVIVLGGIFGFVYGHINSAIKKDSNQELVDKNQNTKNAIPLDVKTDYIGNWGDLYSQRASLSVEDIGNNKLKVDIKWSNSAVSGTSWSFTCNYQNNSNNLVCNNGKQIDTYEQCNGRKMDDAGEVDECSNSGGDVKEVDETVKNNMSATFSLIKGNLKQAMDDVGFFGDRDDVIKNSEDMTLYIKDVSDEDTKASLKKCVFFKYKN